MQPKIADMRVTFENFVTEMGSAVLYYGDAMEQSNKDKLYCAARDVIPYATAIETLEKRGKLDIRVRRKLISKLDEAKQNLQDAMLVLKKEDPKSEVAKVAPSAFEALEHMEKMLNKQTAFER